MTAIVAIRCSDGVVIGADSSATFGDGAGYLRTVEQPYDQKIEIIDNSIIIAGTGYIGHQQSFSAVIKKMRQDKKFNSTKGALDIAKEISQKALSDFSETRIPPHMLQYSAFVACEAEAGPCLIEFPGGQMAQFQPEIKKPNGLWFGFAGNNQAITDAMLSFCREILWKDKTPNLNGGIFTAYLALKHVCDVNVGGVKEPIKIAVLEKKDIYYKAHYLDDEDIQPHIEAVQDMKNYMSKFRDTFEGKTQVAEIPKPNH